MVGVLGLIGASWAEKYADQWMLNDYVLDPNGYKNPVPAYYLKFLKSVDPLFDELYTISD